MIHILKSLGLKTHLNKLYMLALRMHRIIQKILYSIYLYI
jgi:hypothetical protein